MCTNSFTASAVKTFTRIEQEVSLGLSVDLNVAIHLIIAVTAIIIVTKADGIRKCDAVAANRYWYTCNQQF